MATAEATSYPVGPGEIRVVTKPPVPKVVSRSPGLGRAARIKEEKAANTRLRGEI